MRNRNPFERKCGGAAAAETWPSPAMVTILFVMVVFLLNGCSVKKFAINKIGDSLANSGTTFASDDDPELIGQALPFSLKLIESLLAESPKHRGLLFAASSGFTQYAYVYVQQEADAMEDQDVAQAAALRVRARRLYLRGRNYGLRGLEVKHPGFGMQLPADPKTAVRSMTKKDVPLLYWTAASWGAAISVSKDDPDLIADQRIVEALIDRAFELDPDFDDGAIHNFLISYESDRQGAKGDFAVRSEEHFERAVALSDGQMAAPYVAMAETVAVQKQNRAEFESLLHKALAINPDARPEWRLSNITLQQRARWLLGREDQLIASSCKGGDTSCSGE
ncbi:MAG TPA: TRAP transporter TatT component family protein [Candidatus Acidoferrales bacterium]|nr:TRAP transporter TatT component family protein [Candidatus Acidoferrales bacterium]